MLLVSLHFDDSSHLLAYTTTFTTTNINTQLTKLTILAYVLKKLITAAANCLNIWVCAPDARCLNISTNNVLYNGRCYVKYETETLTWYQARGSCVNNGGDLAQFQKDPSLNGYIPQLNTSWLNPSLTYWVGIRWNDRRWKSPGMLLLSKQ